ncbi:MAG: class I adenylate-forming enzyme family protein [Haloarculaceae archaeon]
MYHPTVRDLLGNAAAAAPDSVALRVPETDRTLRYGAWDARVTRVANGLLDMGVRPGDHLSVCRHDSPELLTLLFAAAEVGVVVNPISPRAPPGRLEYILTDAEADVLACDARTLETARQVDADVRPDVLVAPGTRGADASVTTTVDALAGAPGTDPDVDVDEDDYALLLYTSGTTGEPKGVVHTHRNVVEADFAGIPFNRLRPSDASLALGPLYHVGPLLANFMPALHVGATNVLFDDFDAGTVLDYVEKEGVTAMWGVPTHFNAITNHEGATERDLAGVRMIQYSGSAMPREVVRQCRALFPDVEFVNAYGTTEIVFATALYPEDHDDHLGSIGRAVPNAEVRVVDPEALDPEMTVERGEVGELLVKTPTRMVEYWNLPERTAEAFVGPDGEWYRTGDLGRRDESGYLYFVDRTDNMINTGGENVYPAEVEEVLYEHPDVEEVAVVGVPDEEWGQVVAAAVVPADPALDAETLDAFVRESDDIEEFKRPRRYVFREALPMTQSDKIAREELVEDLRDE